MRFLTAAALLALVGSAVDAAPRRYQFDVTGDNTFQVYLSKAGTSTSTVLLGDLDQKDAPDTGAGIAIQTGWNTPARYTGLELDEGDVLSVYVQNIDAAANANDGTPLLTSGNPSAIVGRLREISGAAGTFIPGGNDIPTDEQWYCAYRVEGTNSHLGFEPQRLTGNANDWTFATLDVTNPANTWSLLSGQSFGSDKFNPATEISALGAANIWSQTGIPGPFGVSAITQGVPVDAALGLSTPYWIYGTDQLASGLLVHHGWCRYRVPAQGNIPTSPPAGGNGDPVFSGFQGQEFQFHGLPDEHFNLISSPHVQLNAHFVYLSAGKCDYNNTACWTHPGTYMDVMGFSIGESRVKVVAGSHAAGLRVWVNDAEISRHTTILSLSGNVTASLHYSHTGKLSIQTDLIDYTIHNSDMFMNLQAALKSSDLLKVGSTKHTVTDSYICHANAETHNHQLVEQTVAKKYPITSQLHGLIGQTWRNVKVCGRDWMGQVQDYVTESLFGNSYHYNHFKF